MRRRDVLALVGSGAAIGVCAAFAAAAKPVEGRTARVGVLGTAPWAPFEDLREGLRELGYIEGKHIAFEYRWSNGHNETYPTLAAELVALPVDLIITIATPATLAARDATSTIPILMVPVGDPIKSGLVANLAHPGGNLTGFTIFTADTAGKRVELLKQTLPSLSRLAVLANPVNPYTKLELASVEPAAAALGIALETVEAADDAQLDQALDTLRGSRPDAVFVVNDQFLLSRRDRIVAAVTADRLPSIYGFREYVDAGGLLYYGSNYRAEFRRAADYVDKILNGTKPGDLPVQRATTFELVINLKTAAALGLTVPPSLLAQADEVIE
ncbi:MAG: ABC transporter substrate-binding protein [Alphaproteobacteria bacterium]|nr:ABC transporter substrate-binding protein [Alphaproteobacteria bacterium]